MVEISVIMAVYKLDDILYLDEAIMSILEQTICDLELIICADGSDDQVLSRLSDWTNVDQRIIVIRNEYNKGPAVARNAAVRISKGSYIAIMDADDISAPLRLVKQVSFLKQHPEYAFVGSKGMFFANQIGDRKDTYWFVSRPEPSDFLMTLPFVHASIMFRREAFLSIDGYDESVWVWRSEDYDLLMRLYSCGFKGANLEDVLYYIRFNVGTLKRRKYRYRFNESIVKLKGFTNLKLMPLGFFYAIKPLIVGLVPIKLLNQFKKIYYIDKL